MTVPAFLGLLKTAVSAAEADFPKPITAAIGNRDKLAAAVAALPSASHADAMAAVAAALLDGRDPLVDPAVTRIVTARALGGESGSDLAYGVQNAANARIVDSLAEHVDATLESLKPAIDTAGQTLAETYQNLGDVDLGDAAVIMKLGPQAARQWAEAKEAEKLIRVVDGAWFAIGNLTGIVSTSAPPTLRLADLSLPQYEQLGHKASPWAVVRVGATIDWATRITIDERQQRLTLEREQRERQAEGACANSFSRSHGTGQRAAIA